MMGNSFGKLLVLTTFGESHGIATGGVLDGFPSSIDINIEFIQVEIDRRNPANSRYSTTRKESDIIRILSGVFNGRSTGAPIAFTFNNDDFRSDDYQELKDLYRPSHADFTYEMKYGIRDYRGGGRASARETLARVAGGALAKLFLSSQQIKITSEIISIGPFIFKGNPAGMDDPEFIAYMDSLKSRGDTTGGILSVIISGVPVGLGDPVFDKLHADLGKAMLSIPAVKGFEIGDGLEASKTTGSQHNDRFVFSNGRISTLTNHSGGIQGGISNGMDIVCTIAFKPVSTIMMEQTTVTRSGEEVSYRAKGRHDVCVVPRAAVVAESMAALVIGDHLLRSGLVRR